MCVCVWGGGGGGGATLEKYFPLLPFVTSIIPEGIEGETPSADKLLGEVPNKNLMEEET